MPDADRGLFPSFLITFLLLVAPAALAAPSPGSTADHGRFESLNGPFADGPEVTRACLECHTEAADQIHATTHWKWEFTNPRTGQKLGKKHVINNFCLAAQPNIAACSSCHVGYGWKDDGFDFTSRENVDCLVCHDRTGTYSKSPPTPARRLDEIAHSVGRTSRETCGACHFKGGGGEAVKHGDLDPTMIAPDVFVDVHMDADGANFACATCHSGQNHGVEGSRYATTASDAHGIDVPGADDGSRATCQSCHGEAPHGVAKLNDHTDRVACQTCHIPAYARGDWGTKSWWDWSTAGRRNADGKPYEIHDVLGREIYNSKKGDFRWSDDVVPDYVWFNGTIDYTLLEDRIDPSGVVAINRFHGSAEDPASRIWPVKVMRGRQPYDTGNMTLAVPKTVGADGFWKTLDWDDALARGMAAVGAPYSGKYDFVETEMTWPITHMVAPAEQALGCESCHAEDGRLAGVTGVYMPGRDSNRILDGLGIAALILVIGGVGVHGTMRAVVRNRKGDQ